jgi:glycosyltransferase involved in cell wall biosynthesis
MDPLPRLLLRAIERSTQRLATAYTAVSDAVARFLVEERGVDGTHVQVIHNGIDPMLFAAAREARDAVRAELGFEPAHRVIGTIANFHRRKKGYEVLVEAVPGVLEAFAEARFLWVGGEVDGLQAEIEARLGALGCADRVVMAGRRSDVPRLLAAMDVFVLPSTFEGLGIVVAEAMASGLPVVASDVGGIPEVVTAGETGLLVPVGDAAALGAALRTVLGDPDRATDLGARGRERAARVFGVDRMVAAYAAVFDACG